LKDGHVKVRGISISEEAFCFLEDTLQVDQAKRIGWSELSRHPLITKDCLISGIKNPEIELKE